MRQVSEKRSSLRFPLKFSEFQAPSSSSSKPTTAAVAPVPKPKQVTCFSISRGRCASRKGRGLGVDRISPGPHPFTNPGFALRCVAYLDLQVCFTYIARIWPQHK